MAPLPVNTVPLAIPASIRGARILLVDDYDLNREMVQEFLERLGFTVIVAEDGEQALATLETVRFDLVFMDIHMPVMDGLEATRRIRRHRRFDDMPVIAIFATIMPRDREESPATGMNDHLAKPILPEQLLPVLERWLGTP